MSPSATKIRAARFSLATATSLAVLKLTTGIMTGSMAVLASAVDSLLDILMSGVNYLAIRKAEQPADENHPFGHGKFETLATLFQALVIFTSGLWILYEATTRLLEGAHPQRLGNGVIVLMISVGASVWISRYLKSAAKKTHSSALDADSLHFAMDVYTNLALAAGLVIMSLFDVPWLDSLLSILVAAYILLEALRLVRHGMRDILDEELPASIRQEITDIIEMHKDVLVDHHQLRTRRAGSQKIIDFHLTVCKNLTVKDAHDIADHLEKEIEAEILGADVIIHVEPCRDKDCPGQEHCARWIKKRSQIMHEK